MPIYSLPLTLAELLEVQGTALNDSELWALLYATSKSLSDLFSQGTVSFVVMSACVQFLFCIGCTSVLVVPLPAVVTSFQSRTQSPIITHYISQHTNNPQHIRTQQ